MNKCKSCGASIMWVKMRKSGKANPLDPEPSERGNIALLLTNDDEQQAEVQTEKNLEDARAAKIPLYLSHFVTCPSSNQHRKS